MTATKIAIKERQQPATQEKESKEIRILWADDEIDFLKPYILLLQEEGFIVTGVTNGLDAISEFTRTRFDIVFLDENMPGLSGIDTLGQMKNINEHVPVVMITKTEAESIMQDALSGRIADYLVKPVTMNQVFSSLKKV